MLRSAARSWRSADISLLLPTARRIENAPREKVANATSRTGSRMLRKKDCPGRLKNNNACDTSIPERPLRRSDGKGPTAEID
jgi:hypothetical protein